MTIFLWVLAVVLIVVGVVGTVLPAIPGSTLVFAGIALAAWIGDFVQIPVWIVVVAGVLAALTWVVDFAAAAAGARRVGASPWAVAGAAIGTVAGIFTGLVGLLFLPLAGAAIGEYLAERDMLRAGKVGLATWLGIVIGTALKVAIVFAMLGMFVARCCCPDAASRLAGQEPREFIRVAALASLEHAFRRSRHRSRAARRTNGEAP
jgi:hypothetical protein